MAFCIEEMTTLLLFVEWEGLFEYILELVDGFVEFCDEFDIFLQVLCSNLWYFYNKNEKKVCKKMLLFLIKSGYLNTN